MAERIIRTIGVLTSGGAVSYTHLGKEDLKEVLTDEEYQLLTDNKELKVKWFFFGD